MSNNKKEGTGKKVIGGIALGLVLILLGGVAGGLLQHHYKWGEDEPTVEEPEDPKDEDPTGGTEIDSGEEKGVKLSVRKLMSSEYEEYGVSALAEDAYKLLTWSGVIKPKKKTSGSTTKKKTTSTKKKSTGTKK